jgi:hypothetical protein
MRAAAVLCLAFIALAGCSSSSPPAESAADDAKDEAAHRQLCADPSWKAQHLGLWYNVCSAQRL